MRAQDGRNVRPAVRVADHADIDVAVMRQRSAAPVKPEQCTARKEGGRASGGKNVQYFGQNLFCRVRTKWHRAVIGSADNPRMGQQPAGLDEGVLETTLMVEGARQQPVRHCH